MAQFENELAKLERVARTSVYKRINNFLKHLFSGYASDRRLAIIFLKSQGLTNLTNGTGFEHLRNIYKNRHRLGLC